ncbi:RNA-binding protein 1-like [Crassostrea virginica]
MCKLRIVTNSLVTARHREVEFVRRIGQIYRSIIMANRLKEWRLDCKVYIGDLGYGAAKQELEDVFSRYGPIRNVWVARNPPGFAFVEFQDTRDAEDATKALDGTRINGRRVRVEMSSGKSRWGSRGPPTRRGGGGRGNREERRRSRLALYTPSQSASSYLFPSQRLP